MPLYEYQCKKCKHRFERIRKFSDKPLKKCPECGGPVEQLLSAPAVQFKGSGWYVTDYARKGSGSSGSAESVSAAKVKEEKSRDEKTDSKKSDSTTESKPAAKTETKTEAKSKKEK